MDSFDLKYFVRIRGSSRSGGLYIQDSRLVYGHFSI